METNKKSWMQAIFAYAEGEKKKMILSVIFSVLSVMLGLAPFYCMYRLISLFVAGAGTKAAIGNWCLVPLAAYVGKILFFSLSTGISHSMAYTILESLRGAGKTGRDPSYRCGAEKCAFFLHGKSGG